MGADRSRTRTRTAKVLTACLATLIVVELVPAAISSARATATGSSCEHPWQATYQVGGSGGGFEGDQKRIYMSGTPRRLSWVVWPKAGNVICSARVRLADGRWVGPTKLLPYTTPTPIGGEYRAPHGPHSPLRTIIVTAARSQVPPGASCNYPVFGSQSVNGAPAAGSDTKDLSVKVKIVSDPNPGSTEPMSLRLEIDIHNPRVVICRASLTVLPRNSEGFIRDETAESYPVTVSPDGTVTSEDIEVPADDGFSGIAYARLQ
jgi:hypothetical protein